MSGQWACHSSLAHGVCANAVYVGRGRQAILERTIADDELLPFPQ